MWILNPHFPVARSSSLARFILSLSRATLEAPSGLSWNDTATQAVGRETELRKHFPGETHSPADDWRFYVRWVRALLSLRC